MLFRKSDFFDNPCALFIVVWLCNITKVLRKSVPEIQKCDGTYSPKENATPRSLDSVELEQTTTLAGLGWQSTVENLHRKSS